MNKAIMACIADDFTGASDLASFMHNAGAKTLLINGIPADDFQLDKEYNAVVIALKIRSIKPQEAVEQTIKALEWLKRIQAKHFYYKYCSTFDSTPEGNIGPVLDAMLEYLDLPYTILCPALPINKRTVKDGILYVGDLPLGESHMKDHPLNPMWDSKVSKLMEDQSKYPCVTFNKKMLYASDETIKLEIEKLKKRHKHFYIVTDYYEDSHGDRIAQIFRHLPLMSGGSVLPANVLKNYLDSSDYKPTEHKPSSKIEHGLILSGSCSTATRSQIIHYQKQGGVSYRIYAEKLLSGEQSIEQIWEFIKTHSPSNVLVYSINDGSTNEINKIGQEKISQVLESTIAKIAQLAIQHGTCKLIVAGGETSGSVITGINSCAFEIGESVAPGVPVLYPLNKNYRLVLKSGNFGQEDFFARALKQM